MLEIFLSHHPKAQRFVYGNDAVAVTSRSGLNFSEKALLEMEEQWKPRAKVLVIENRTAVLGLTYKHRFPETEIFQHSLDDFYHQKLNSILAEHKATEQIALSCAPDLPGEEGSFDEAFFQVSQSLSAEMTAEYLQQIHQKLRVGGRLWVGIEKHHRTAPDQVRKCFGAATETRHRFGMVLVVKKKAELKKIKEYRANFEVSVERDVSLSILTRPGVFSHRRPDEGAMALVDTVKLKGGERVLEMGCGSGLVALSLQKRTPNCELFLLDSHTRAIEVSRINAEQNGLPVPNLACSSQGWPEEASFDVFIGNPPYFGDHQISGLFIDTAADCLDEGGVMWIVAKSMDWNRDYAEEHFEKIEVFQRRGYGVMKAIRKSKSI